MTQIVASIQHAADTEANWIAQNPILIANQIYVATDVFYPSSTVPKIKIGKGDPWNDTQYLLDGTVSSIINLISGKTLRKVLQSDNRTIDESIIISDGTKIVLEGNSPNSPLIINADQEIVEISWNDFLQALAAETTANRGQAGGYAPLDNNAKLPLTHLPDAVLGNVKYKGNIDCTSNVISSSDQAYNGNPLPAASANNEGHYLIVIGAAFNGNLPNIGNIDVDPGDWLISTGASWQIVDNVDAVKTVNGQKGNVSITPASIGAQAALGYTPENAANKATNLNSPNNTTYPTTQAVADNVLHTWTNTSIFTQGQKFIWQSPRGDFRTYIVKTGQTLNAGETPFSHSSKVERIDKDRTDIIFSSGENIPSSPVSITGNTKVLTIPFYAGEVQVGDSFEVLFRYSRISGTNGTQQLKGYASPTDTLTNQIFLSSIITTQNTASRRSVFTVKSNTTIRCTDPTSNTFTDTTSGAASNAALQDITIANINNDWFFTISLQNLSSGDSCQIDFAEVRLKKKFTP